MSATISIAEVAAAGGGRDHVTLPEVYKYPDDESILKVMSQCHASHKSQTALELSNCKQETAREPTPQRR
jgi:hypothetical protein